MILLTGDLSYNDSGLFISGNSSLNMVSSSESSIWTFIWLEKRNKVIYSSHLPYEGREREMQYLCNHLFLFVLSYGFSAWNLFQFLYFSKRRLCSTWRLTLPRRWFRRKSDIRSCRNALLVLVITVSFFIQIGYFLSSLLKKSNVSFFKSLTKKTSWSLQDLDHVIHTLFVCFRVRWTSLRGASKHHSSLLMIGFVLFQYSSRQFWSLGNNCRSLWSHYCW